MLFNSEKTMIGYILAALAGGIATALFFKASPKIAAKFFKITEYVESKIEKKIGKDI